MHGHIFLLQSQRLRDGIPRALRALRRRPHFSLAVAVYRQRSRRFHRGMCQQRRIVFRLDDFSALRKGLIHVAVLSNNLPRLVRCLLQLLLVCIRIPNAVQALLPFDLQLFLSLHRRPGVIRQHRHAAEGLKADWRLEGIDRRRLLHSSDA